MRTVRCEVVSSKPVALAKAARVFSLFAASSDAGALVLRAAEAAAELHAFRRDARESRAREGIDGEAGAAESGQKRRKKRKAE